MATEIFDSSNVHIDVDLTNFAVGLGSNMGKFVADRIFPEVMVGKQSDKYLQFGAEHLIDEDDVQGDKSHPKEVERTFERKDYFCERHALTDFLPDSWRTNADDAMARALDDTSYVKFLKEKVLLRKELAVKTLLATSGNYATGHYENMDTVANRNFDDSSGPGALKLLLTFLETIEGACGAEADTMLVSSDAWVYLSTDTAFFGGGDTKVALTPQQLAEILNLRQVLKVSPRYANQKPKAGGAVTLSRLWTSNCIWLLCAPPSQSMLDPSVGKTFKWNATGGYQNGEMVRTIRDERTGDGGTWFEYKQHYVPKLTLLDSSSDIISGAFLANVYNVI